MKEALRIALEALESCYNVREYPADGTTFQDQAITAIKESLSAEPEQPAPVQGWKLVPLEPTDEMLDSAQERIDDIYRLDAMHCYEAMLAAAPQQAPVQHEPVALNGQRKLVQILAENWRVWPARKSVEQTSLGDVYCSEKGRDLMLGNHEIASDQDSAVVTKEMWSTMRQALAEQPAQQEPVACANGCRGFVKNSQPQRTWVGLTENEVLECRSANHLYFYKAIEAKLKEKNNVVL